MPISWELIGSFALNHRQWVRLPVIEYSELFRVQFSTPDWVLWRRHYSGRVLLRSVFLPALGVEEVSQTTHLFVDDTPSGVVVDLPYPNGYLTSGISRRHIEAYRYTRHRWPVSQLELSMTIEKA